LTLRAPDVTRSQERLNGMLRRLSDRAMRQQEERSATLDALERLRKTLGYPQTLERGFAVVRGDGVVVTSTDGLKKAKSVEVEFADGRVTIGSGTTGSLL
jgi:exodeoxyribonuclease VII large subunit